MRFNLLTFTLLFIFLTGCSTYSTSNHITDNEITSLLIGSWYTSHEDPNYLSGNAISTYMQDVTVTYRGYSDIFCKKLEIQTKATWHIKNGNLYITIDSSTAPTIHPAGLTVTDNIIDINKKSKTLLSIPEGITQYRTKEDTCINTAI
jgi:hypothetical protein